MTPAAARLVLISRRMLELIATDEVRATDVVSDQASLKRFLALKLRRSDGEKAVAIVLNAANQVLAVGDIGEQEGHAVQLDVRRLVRLVLDSNGRGVIIAHNHPSGDATPSRHDIVATQRLGRILADLDIALHDHVIVGIGKMVSLRGLGCMGHAAGFQGEPQP